MRLSQSKIKIGSTCYHEFRNSLIEVDIIINQAETSQKEVNKYAALNKSSLLLLMAKFERFLENLIFAYVQALQNLRLFPDSLSDLIKVHSVSFVLNDEFFQKLRSFNSIALSEMKSIAPLFYPTVPLDNIRVDHRFDYGKHGSRKIEKLFKRIGIIDIFSNCLIIEEKSTLQKTQRQRTSFAPDINAMTNHRNVILHEDRSPTLTHRTINTFKERSILFGESLIKLLQKELSKVERKNQKLKNSLHSKRGTIKKRKKSSSINTSKKVLAKKVKKQKKSTSSRRKKSTS